MSKTGRCCDKNNDYLGTRPEIIRLSLIIKKLDQDCQHVLVHTGQNYDPNLKDIFFKNLEVREPDYYLNAKGSFGEQVGTIFKESETVIRKEKPDRLLILGDTNSGLAAVVAKRFGIPVYHMEAGNRCYDDRVPEEVNRRIIDHTSDILMPYTQRSRENLLAEGIPGHRIHVIGNPIKEVIDYFETHIKTSPVLEKLGLKNKQYFLVTLHRAENVDIPQRLQQFMTALSKLHHRYNQPVICSLHPRTRQKLEAFHITADRITFIEPRVFFDFVHLEKNARCVLSDSGTGWEIHLFPVYQKNFHKDFDSNIILHPFDTAAEPAFDVKVKHLENTIKTVQPDILHSLETQRAG